MSFKYLHYVGCLLLLCLSTKPLRSVTSQGTSNQSYIQDQTDHNTKSSIGKWEHYRQKNKKKGKKIFELSLTYVVVGCVFLVSMYRIKFFRNHINNRNDETGPEEFLFRREGIDELNEREIQIIQNMKNKERAQKLIEKDKEIDRNDERVRKMLDQRLVFEQDGIYIKIPGNNGEMTLPKNKKNSDNENKCGICFEIKQEKELVRPMCCQGEYCVRCFGEMAKNVQDSEREMYPYGCPSCRKNIQNRYEVFLPLFTVNNRREETIAESLPTEFAIKFFDEKNINIRLGEEVQGKKIQK